MKALCWYGKNDVRVATVPDPHILNPRDAIIKITTTAICGSDLHLYDGYIFRVPEAMSLPEKGHGCFYPPLPCRLLCPEARETLFPPMRDVTPPHALSRQRGPCSHLWTRRCLLRSQRRRRRCACVAGICASLSAKSRDNGEGSMRKYQSRLRPCQTLWRTACNMLTPASSLRDRAAC
jgi:hypothetical protein